jgi:hypothetical protein
MTLLTICSKWRLSKKGGRVAHHWSPDELFRDFFNAFFFAFREGGNLKMGWALERERPSQIQDAPEEAADAREEAAKSESGDDGSESGRNVLLGAGSE